MSNLRKDILIYAAIQSNSDRSRLEDMLVLDGLDISTFVSPNDLWDHFRPRQPRIVITDRKFGYESSGLELARKIRKNYTLPYTYILIRSALERSEDMEEALAAGADDYIIRPHNPLQMRSRVLVASRWIAYMDSLFAGKRKENQTT